jgi:hypothetical protein
MLLIPTYWLGVPSLPQVDGITLMVHHSEYFAAPKVTCGRYAIATPTIRFDITTFRNRRIGRMTSPHQLGNVDSVAVASTNAISSK